MTFSSGRILTITALAISAGWLPLPARAQDAPPVPGAAVDSPADDRRGFLESRRWRQAFRRFHQWLAVQQLYDPDEVAAIKAEFDMRIETMSASQLEELVEDMEEKLEVLMSPKAEEARLWLSQFLATQARYSDQQLRARRPDVARMTAAEIRLELQQFQQRRAATQQAQAAFDQGRMLQVQSLQAAQAANQLARAQAAQGRGAPRINNPPYRSRYAPRRDATALTPRPRFYSVGPWGTLLRAHPLGGD